MQRPDSLVWFTTFTKRRSICSNMALCFAIAVSKQTINRFAAALLKKFPAVVHTGLGETRHAMEYHSADPEPAATVRLVAN
jgi:hypothetical protein